MNRSTSLPFRSMRKLPLYFLFCGLILAACSEDNPTQPTSKSAASYDAAVPTAWFDMQLALVEKTPGFSPPVASRAFGYSGVALYQSVVAGMPEYHTLEGQLNGLAAGSIPAVQEGMEYHWPSVANATLARISSLLFDNATAEMKGKIDSMEMAIAATFTADVDSAVAARSIAYGRSVADAVYEWSKNDGGDKGYLTNFPTSYTPPTGEGLWVPTPRKGGNPQSALQPYWGENRPFILPQGNPNATTDPGAPPAYSTETSSQFYVEANEVYTTLKSLTPAQLAIAQYWSDDPGTTCTPPGHSMSIMTQCLNLGDSKLDAAAACYAQMGIAVADAFIACWDTKYDYNLIRPITVIMQTIDPTYDYNDMPLNTPPFPEYTSGHSVQSGAASSVLNSVFGTTFAFTDHTHDAKGLPARSYPSFDSAANEAAISRLYGGIHYRSAIEKGVVQGKKVGDIVMTQINWKN